MKKITSLLVIIFLLVACSSNDKVREYPSEETFKNTYKIDSTFMDIPLLGVDITSKDLKEFSFVIDYIKAGSEDVTTYEVYYDYETIGYRIKVYIDEKYIARTLSIGFTYSSVILAANP